MVLSTRRNPSLFPEAVAQPQAESGRSNDKAEGRAGKVLAKLDDAAPRVASSAWLGVIALRRQRIYPLLKHSLHREK